MMPFENDSFLNKLRVHRPGAVYTYIVPVMVSAAEPVFYDKHNSTQSPMESNFMILTKSFYTKYTHTRDAWEKVYVLIIKFDARHTGAE
jgi:hypothetical protein